MQKPLVSILTPFKNTEKYLADCINSIFNQTYTNWELIIVDDCSTDNSFELVNNFAKIDNRIKLLKNSGIGIIEALRLAFEESKGELITRMDSDDIMASNKIEVLVNNLLDHGKKHVAIGLVKYFSEDEIGPGYKSYENWLNKLTFRGNNYSEIYKECVIPSPCWMVYKTDLVTCGAFQPNIYPEDYDLTFRFYKHEIICIPCQEVLHYWRDYKNRTSRTHVHYAQNHFTALKTHYFLDIDYKASRPLVIWGAGNKGKIIARILIDRYIAFKWVCNNPKKIGKKIYGKTMLDFKEMKHIENCQSIITVANKTAQKEIKNYMGSLSLKPVKDYFFFC